MRILIQDSESQKFLSPEVAWTPVPDEAREFPTATRAFDLAKHLIAGPFQIMLHFPASGELVHFIDGVGRASQYRMV